MVPSAARESDESICGADVAPADLAGFGRAWVAADRLAQALGRELVPWNVPCALGWSDRQLVVADKTTGGATSGLRAALVALMAFTGFAFSSAAHADSGFVKLTIYKAGWIIGGSGGGGVLTFRGRSYPLSTGGLDYGLVFGGSKTVLRGRVSNINRPSDVAGVYGAAGAGTELASLCATPSSPSAG